MWMRLGFLKDWDNPLYFSVVENHGFVWPVRNFPPRGGVSSDGLRLPVFEYSAVVCDPYEQKDLLEILFSHSREEMILEFVEGSTWEDLTVMYYHRILGVEPFEISTRISGEGHYHFDVRASYQKVLPLMKPSESPVRIYEKGSVLLCHDPKAEIHIPVTPSDEEEGEELPQDKDGVQRGPSKEKVGPDYDENPGRPLMMGDS